MMERFLEDVLGSIDMQQVDADVLKAVWNGQVSACAKVEKNL